MGAAGSAGRADSAGGARSSGGAGSSDSGAGRIGGAAGGIAGVEAAGAVVAAARGEAVVTALDVRGARGGGTAPTALIEHLSSADAVLVVGEDDTDVRMAAVGEFATSGHGAPDAPVARDAHGAVGETGALHTVDPATPLHRVALAPRRRGGVAARAERSAATQQAPAPRSAVLRREAALLTAAQQLGSASCTVGTAVRYAGEREQFGRPIGAFQAVKHLCAQMLVRAEIARSAVYAAAVTGDAYDIAAAKLLADDAAVRNARDCLQVHGGMGFTWEADVHLHLKRAWVRSGQWQSAAEAEELLADSLVGRRMSRQKAPSTECPNDSHEFG
ncbi:acyl-CoA dehydrogenase family protein [Streptomyces sp. NPDC048639]|uniref:acyl-CoA dehydrogenase family protein n=1 Tax=Streptomyces sp. NPDC048639 TaxID=3365581 RepID=UPI003722BE23